VTGYLSVNSLPAPNPKRKSPGRVRGKDAAKSPADEPVLSAHQLVVLNEAGAVGMDDMKRIGRTMRESIYPATLASTLRLRAAMR
jgi:hypothetical protein